jgi:dGTPase
LGHTKNLNLTYAVRDGVISHCGEVNENAIFPRKEYIDLSIIEKPNQYQPYTWEGCVVDYIGETGSSSLLVKVF